MLAFPSNHYKDKIRSRKSTPKLSAYELSQDDYDNWRYNFPNIQPTAGFVRNPVSDELDVELQKTLNKEMKEPGLL